MEKQIEHFWMIRLTALQEKLKANNFEAFLVQNRSEAQKVVLDEILVKTKAKSISWGGSMTITATGLFDALKAHHAFRLVNIFDKAISPEEMLQRRREALSVDLFITGTNAVTEDGRLVNLDMIGNRVSALTYGPQHVAVLVGRNKLVPDLEAAMRRIKEYAAPANAMRLDKKTPCVKTGTCELCKSPDRICNTWTITEKSFPKGRVKVVLINEILGL